MVIKMDINAMPITIGVKAENMDLKSLNDLLEDNVANRLERIEGVASVSLSGGITNEVRITVDPVKPGGLRTDNPLRLSGSAGSRKYEPAFR